jgi:G3E family GTPase
MAGRRLPGLSRTGRAVPPVPARHGRVAPADVLGTGRFDLERAQQAPGWVMELNGDHMPETEEYGISSTVFRAGRPFHPCRLWEFVTDGLDSGAYGQILRSKGFFWLATRPKVTGLWSQAGAVARSEPSGAHDTGSGHDEQGQELVFIGTGLRPDALGAALTACLLTDAESVPAHDPFPAWDTYGIDDACEHEHDAFEHAPRPVAAATWTP